MSYFSARKPLNMTRRILSGIRHKGDGIDQLLVNFLHGHFMDVVDIDCT